MSISNRPKADILSGMMIARLMHFESQNQVVSKSQPHARFVSVLIRDNHCQQYEQWSK